MLSGSLNSTLLRAGGAAASAVRAGSHLMVLPVPLTVRAGVLHCELQACDAIQHWARHFESLTLAAPCLPMHLAAERKYIDWRPVKTLGLAGRIRFIPLPWAYTVRQFLRELPVVRDRLREAIGRSQYLQFAVGGAIGDWPSVAAEMALRMGRAYAIHVDSVATELEWTAATTLRRRIKAMVHVPAIRVWERRLIRHAGLVLCNGDATFEAYHRLNPRSRVIYNVAVHVEDRISDEQLRRKTASLAANEPLNVVYAGRIASEKAPLQWVRAIAQAVGQGARIRATWLGDGEMREAMRREIAATNMESVIALPGFVSDRGALLDALRSAHVLAFTHLIRESPRILAEALVSATPIVGYNSAYARGLVAGHGGGRFVPVGDAPGLAQLLIDLDRNRSEVAGLIESARQDGAGLNAEAMFAHRSGLLKQYL